MMTVSTEQILAVVGAGATVTTGIFWAAFYLGKIWNRLDRHDQQIDDHERRLDEHGRILSGRAIL